MLENSKRKRIALKQKRRQEASEQKVKKEVEKKIEIIRQEKKEKAKILKKEIEKAPKTPLKLGDRVRIINGTAVGTIDILEKGKAIVNYGMFTTKIDTNQLEKVR